MKTFTGPAVESLLSCPHSIWPEIVSNNEEFQRLARQRRDLISNVDYLLHVLFADNKNIADLFSLEVKEQEKIIAAYNDVAEFISCDEISQRLAYYLPFEIIPDSAYISQDDPLSDALRNFSAVYKNIWRRLLYIYELRANFLNGDIQSNTDDKESFVCKAAHLIPALLQKKILSFSEVTTILKENRSKTLKESLLDAILASADLGIIQVQELQIAARSKDLDCLKFLFPYPKEAANFTALKDLDDLATVMDKAKKECSINRNHCVKNFSRSEPGRAEWVEACGRQKIISHYAEIIANSLHNEDLSWEDFLDYASRNNEEDFLLLAVNSIRMMIEKCAKSDIITASFLAIYCKRLLYSVSLSDYVGVKKSLESTLCRWFNADIIEASYLSDFDLKPRELEGETLSENVCSVEEYQHLINALNLIRDNKEFSKYFYPLFNLYGSRMKGCGSKFTDIDLAVFVKPGVNPSEHKKLAMIMDKALQHEKIKGRVLQFWLVEHEQYLKVTDHFHDDKLIANGSYAHVLFGGAWLGDLEIIKEMHAKLLAPYLFTGNTSLIRTCLHELERDNLQYPLLHKGYAYLFPEGKRFETRYIDANCSFYDSGYRKLAAKLFLRKVFLPQFRV